MDSNPFWGQIQDSVEKNILHAHSTFPFTSPFGLRNLGLGSDKMVRKAYY